MLQWLCFWTALDSFWCVQDSLFQWRRYGQYVTTGRDAGHASALVFTATATRKRKCCCVNADFVRNVLRWSHMDISLPKCLSLALLFLLPSSASDALGPLLSIIPNAMHPHGSSWISNSHCMRCGMTERPSLQDPV